MNPHRIHSQLSRFAKSRLALSTVVTTLIVLVVSVLLAGVVTYFAINVTSTRVQEESLALTKQLVWYDFASGKAQTAVMVINAGGRDVVIDRLTVRGQECTWSKVFYATVSGSVSGDLFYNSTLVDGGTISVGGSDRVFEQASNDLTVQSGETLIVYVTNPDSISVNDIGLTVSVNIFTSQAMYYKETNVQGSGGIQTTEATPSPSAENGDFTMLFAKAYHNNAIDEYEIAMVITQSSNSGEGISIYDLIIKGQSASHSEVIWYYLSSDLQATDDLPYLTSMSGPVQTHTLTWTVNLALHPGETIILYFCGDGPELAHSDVGTSISVGINLDNGGSLTKTVRVENA